MPPNPMEAGPPPTRIVQLTEAVTMEELANDEEYQDILDDMRDECGKVSPPPFPLHPSFSASSPLSLTPWQTYKHTSVSVNL